MLIYHFSQPIFCFTTLYPTFQQIFVPRIPQRSKRNTPRGKFTTLWADINGGQSIGHSLVKKKQQQKEEAKNKEEEGRRRKNMTETRQKQDNVRR